MKENVILFDGVCILCNKCVQYIIAHDPKAKFKFAPLQSEIGKKIMAEHDLLNDNHLESLVLITSNAVFHRSTAVIKIAKELKGIARLLGLLVFLPPFLRNFLYDTIAKNRYKWLGRSQSCQLPTKNNISRFLV